MQAVQKDLRWTCCGEGAEGGAGDARSAQDKQQGVLAAPEAARRDRARHLAQSHTALDRLQFAGGHFYRFVSWVKLLPF